MLYNPNAFVSVSYVRCMTGILQRLLVKTKKYIRFKAADNSSQLQIQGIKKNNIFYSMHKTTTKFCLCRCYYATASVTCPACKQTLKHEKSP